MHGSLCVCALIPDRDSNAPRLVIHRLRGPKAHEHGRLATLSLVNSEIVVRGHEAQPSAALPFAPEQPLLLFPLEDAVPIERFAPHRAPSR